MTEEVKKVKRERPAMPKDPELLTLQRIERLLAGLDDHARERVVAYLAARHRPMAKTGCNAIPLSPGA